MNKRLLSMFLALCMVVTLLPVSATADEINMTIVTSGEIIQFAPLEKTRRAVSLGTSIEDLELPKTLTATVQTAVSIGEDSVQDADSPDMATTTESEWEETSVEIPVTWESTPEYDMDTEGEYIFTPVIEGYTASALLPQIKVTVGMAILGRSMVSPLVSDDVIYNIWVGGVQVTAVNKGDVLNDGGTVTYDPATYTLTLEDAIINKARIDSFWGDTFCIHSEISEPLKLNLIGNNVIKGVNSTRSTYGIKCSDKLTIEGTGSLTITPGEAYTGSAGGNNHSSGILTEGGLTINNVTLDIRGDQYGLYEYSDGDITINGGRVTAYGNKAAIEIYHNENLKITGKKISVMVGDAEPGTALDSRTNLAKIYKYVKLEFTDDMAEIGDVGYKTLQAAVDVVENGQTITLLDDIDLTEAVTIPTDDDKNFILDLNGKTLNGGNDIAIDHKGSGKLTIMDTSGGGKVMNNSFNESVIALSDSASLDVGGVTVESSNESTTDAVIRGGHDVTVTGGGRVIANGDNHAIYTKGTVMVDGDGTVVSSVQKSAIFTLNSDNGSVTIQGGMVFTLKGNPCGDTTSDIDSTGDSVILYYHADPELTNPNFITLSGTGMVIGWDKSSAGENPSYTAGQSTHIQGLFNGGTAVWAWGDDNYQCGIRYTNGSNTGFIRLGVIVTAAPPAAAYYITATAGEGGNISPKGSVTVNSSSSQTFTISPNSKYSIADVKVDDVSQGKITSYTFSNVTVDHTISATFSYNGGGSGGSGGGSSLMDNSSSVIITRPTAAEPDRPTQGEIKVPGTADGKGNITVNITDKIVTDAFDKALADAKQNGNEKNGITVVLKADTGIKIGSNFTVNLPKTVQDTIIAKKIVNIIVVVDNPDIRIGMDLATVKEINKQAKSDVNITATRGDSGKLTADAKKAIGSRPVFDLKVNYGSSKQVQSFGTGSVSVAIPYTLGANEEAENIYAVYVDDNGQVHWLENSVYDSAEKVVRFSTEHFSTYGVGYKRGVEDEQGAEYKQDAPIFTDISSHWAEKDIAFVVSLGLFSGTSATTFSPNTAMTRGMFVTALGRLANANVSDYAKSSFTDVKSDAYYMGYIEWASKNNIVSGIGNGKFAPDQVITREQMAVIMSNYAKIMDYNLPQVQGEKTFGDSAKISAYAKDAVKQMQRAGVIGGKSDTLFDSQGTATRAEVSAVLHRLVELENSSDTL